MTLQDFFAILRQRWRIIVATMLAVVAVTCLVTIQTPPVYESMTEVHLVASGGEGANGEPANLYAMPAGELETIVRVADSPVVLGPVREALGLDSGYPLDVDVAASGDTTLLDVRVRADNPQVAADVAATIPPTLASVSRRFSSMLSSSGSTVTTDVIVPATVPGAPISPDVKRNIATGIAAGLLLGIAFALLRHNLDTRVRDVRDIAALSDRPVLARVPLRKVANRQTLFLDTDPFGPHAEAIRRMRTNLMFVDVTTRQHAFAITSSQQSEGKTTTAINLAMSIADGGTRVLLVDADLRNPSVAKTMGMEGAVGLTTVLLGRAELHDVVQQWGKTPLFVLPAGEIPPNPSELLGSEAMTELFAQMSSGYDFVLFDTPPVLPVTDALVVDRLTKGTILVVAANRTLKRHLQESLRLIETAGAHLGGFTLNMVPEENSTYYGYYKGSAEAAKAHNAPRRSHKEKEPRGKAGREQRLERSRALAAAEAMQGKTSATDGLEQSVDDADALELRSATRAGGRRS